MTAIVCSHCRKRLSLPATFTGRRVRCPACGQVVELPEATAQPAQPAKPAERWFYARDRQKVGPITTGELREAARSGRLGRDDMVLREGGERWAPAHTVGGLFPAPKEPPPRPEKQSLWPKTQKQALDYWQHFRTWPRSWQYGSYGGATLVMLLLLWIAWPRAKAPLVPAPPDNVGPLAVHKEADEPPPTKGVVEEPKRIPPAPAAVAKVLARLNEVRQLAKAGTVGLETTLSRGCQAHAAYLALNPAEAADPYQHKLDLPGSSEEGKRAADSSLVVFADPAGAVDDALARFFQRVLLLDPQLQSVGLGVAQAEDGKWVVVFDPFRGRGQRTVFFPSDGQTDVPHNFAGGAELSAPLNKQNAGFPISVTFPPDNKVTRVKATLAKNGAQVPVELSTPEKSPNPDAQRNTVCLIPSQPLAARTTYQVHVAALVDGQPWNRTWSFTTDEDLDTSGQWAQKALARVNEFRRAANLDPVTLDDDLTLGCRNHARYLVVNLNHPAVQGLGAHDEDDSLPGYTPEGKKAGKAGNIALGEFDPIASIDGWMATLYHRVPILDPRLRRIGFCCARGPRLGWITVLDVLNGRDKNALKAPMVYPGDGQKNVPVAFPAGGEIPDPIPQDKDGKAGYPITVTFPTGMNLGAAMGTLKDDKGRDVAVWFSSPAQPANPRYTPHQGTTVCLIPQDPLRPATTYTVQLQGELEGQPWMRTWSFTTASSDSDSAQLGQEIVARINDYRRRAGLPGVVLDAELSKGCQAHTDYLAANLDARRGKGFNPNDEDPSLPRFSPAGQEAARRSDLFFSAPTPVAQVDMTMAGLYRRIYILDPELRRVGVGCTYEPGHGWACALNLISGRESTGGDQPITYPAPAQDNVPRIGKDRFPKAPADEPAGYPITVTFPPAYRVQDAQAVLANVAGQTFDTYLSAPDRPLHKDYQGNTICVLPRQPLAANTIYQVTVTARINGQPWRQGWRFETGP